MTFVTQLMLLFLIVCAIAVCLTRYHLYGLFDDYVHHLDYARIA